jgi:hypothetical protein
MTDEQEPASLTVTVYVPAGKAEYVAVPLPVNPAGDQLYV